MLSDREALCRFPVLPPCGSCTPSLGTHVHTYLRREVHRARSTHTSMCPSLRLSRGLRDGVEFMCRYRVCAPLRGWDAARRSALAWAWSGLESTRAGMQTSMEGAGRCVGAWAREQAQQPECTRGSGGVRCKAWRRIMYTRHCCTWRPCLYRSVIRRESRVLFVGALLHGPAVESVRTRNRLRRAFRFAQGKRSARLDVYGSKRWCMYTYRHGRSGLGPRGVERGRGRPPEAGVHGGKQTGASGPRPAPCCNASIIYFV